MRILVLISAIVIGLIAAAGAQSASERIDVASLAGKTRAQFKATFPKLVPEGTRLKAVNWRGWNEVVLEFGSRKQLTAISFIPASPISEDEAKKRLTEQLGVKLDQSKYVAAPAVHAFRSMPGPIRTINLTKADEGSGYQVGEIGVYFNVPY